MDVAVTVVASFVGVSGCFTAYYFVRNASKSDLEVALFGKRPLLKKIYTLSPTLRSSGVEMMDVVA